MHLKPQPAQLVALELIVAQPLPHSISPARHSLLLDGRTQAFVLVSHTQPSAQRPASHIFPLKSLARLLVQESTSNVTSAASSAQALRNGAAERDGT